MEIIDKKNKCLDPQSWNSPYCILTPCLHKPNSGTAENLSENTRVKEKREK